MPSAAVTSKGQVTIPKSIRRLLKIETGDRLDFVVEKAGRIVLRAGSSEVSGLKGLLHKPGRAAVTLEEMQSAIARQGRPRR